MRRRYASPLKADPRGSGDRHEDYAPFDTPRSEASAHVSQLSLVDLIPSSPSVLATSMQGRGERERDKGPVSVDLLESCYGRP